MTWDMNTLRVVNAKVNLLAYETQIGDDWNPYTENGFDCNNYATRCSNKPIQHLRHQWFVLKRLE